MAQSRSIRPHRFASPMVACCVDGVSEPRGGGPVREVSEVRLRPSIREAALCPNRGHHGLSSRDLRLSGEVRRHRPAQPPDELYGPFFLVRYVLRRPVKGIRHRSPRTCPSLGRSTALQVIASSDHRLKTRMVTLGRPGSVNPQRVLEVEQALDSVAHLLFTRP
jgi:hypothetical protein